MTVICRYMYPEEVVGRDDSMALRNLSRAILESDNVRSESIGFIFTKA